MKLLFKLTIIILIITLNSCSKDKKEISLIKEINQKDEMILAYKEGIENLNKGDSFYAAKKFLEAELLYPQSDWAPKSSLMAAYSYYIQDYYSESINVLERFINTYPKDSRMDYVHYLLGMCYYQTIEDEKNDLQPLILAKKNFQVLLEKYPNTEFAFDAKFKIGLVDDVLASKEMYLGRYYIKKEKWIPAINRFKNVVNNFDTTIYTEEAIHRLVEIHYKIGLEEESRKYASLLSYNYLSSEWYKKSYKIFNNKYETKKLKKEKNNLIKKFKRLFE
jgi:outer membrane protein assembly factor BamD